MNRNTFVLVAGFLFCSSYAFGATLVEEKFDKVTGIGTTQRTVQNILATSSNELAPGTSWSVTAPATNLSVNVRHTNNSINASTAVIERFYQAFTPINDTNNFLVLGDDSGAINNQANGGISQYYVPFVNPLLGEDVRIRFDFAFNGWDSAAGRNENFMVYLSDGTNFINLIDLFSPPGAGRPPVGRGSNWLSGQYDESVSTESLTGVNLTLTFELNEGREAANTVRNAAAGIDNIKVISEDVSTAVPEPSTFLLLGAGLGGLAILRRRRK